MDDSKVLRGIEVRIHKRVLALRAGARPPLDWL
jgi:hypothetical protein